LSLDAFSYLFTMLKDSFWKSSQRSSWMSGSCEVIHVPHPARGDRISGTPSRRSMVSWMALAWSMAPVKRLMAATSASLSTLRRFLRGVMMMSLPVALGGVVFEVRGTLEAPPNGVERTPTSSSAASSPSSPSSPSSSSSSADSWVSWVSGCEASLSCDSLPLVMPRWRWMCFSMKSKWSISHCDLTVRADAPAPDLDTCLDSLPTDVRQDLNQVLSCLTVMSSSVAFSAQMRSFIAGFRKSREPLSKRRELPFSHSTSSLSSSSVGR